MELQYKPQFVESSKRNRPIFLEISLKQKNKIKLKLYEC